MNNETDNIDLESTKSQESTDSTSNSMQVK